MPLRTLLNAAALCVAAFVLCGLALVITGTRESIAVADLIIVPGNTVFPDSSLSPRLEARCRRALELHRAGYAPVIFASGGIEPGGLDESALMKRWFLSQGVADSAVVTDSLGANSWLTARNAARWLLAHDRRSALVVTQGFHVPRMRLACARAGIAPVYWSHARFREMRDLYSIARELPGLVSYAVRPSEED